MPQLDIVTYFPQLFWALIVMYILSLIIIPLNLPKLFLKDLKILYCIWYKKYTHKRNLLIFHEKKNAFNML